MDVRPENILISNPDEDNLTSKLGDFGMCEKALAKSEKRHAILASVFKMPEIYIDENYSFPANIWSIGITVIEMVL